MCSRRTIFPGGELDFQFQPQAESLFIRLGWNLHLIGPALKLLHGGQQLGIRQKIGSIASQNRPVVVPAQKRSPGRPDCCHPFASGRMTSLRLSPGESITGAGHPSGARFRGCAYAFRSMLLARFAVPRSLFPLPIPPGCESGHYRDCHPHRHQQCDHHCDDRDKGLGHRGSPSCLSALVSGPPSSGLSKP